MIYCNLNRLSRYAKPGTHLDTAIRYLQTHDLMKLPMGKTLVDSDNVYINRFDYETAEHNLTEAHPQDIDIHIVLEGAEYVGIADVTAMPNAELTPDGDLLESVRSFPCMCRLEPGDILIVFPEDAHCPKLWCGSTGHVKKVVIKVKDQ